MSKTLRPEDRKGIVITNDAPMHIYGGIRGPITSKYYETVEKIAAILSDQAKVAQVTSKGEKIELDFTNFDKDLDPYDDEIDEVLELITCTPDKIIDLEVTKTATISTDVEACTFESLNTAIATVTQEGIVTGVKDGETSIRVSKEGYRTVSVPITVIAQPSVTCTPPLISGLVVGQTLKLTATPESATFRSESDAIATVTPDGTVEAIAQGNTKIIVSAEGYQSTEVPVTTRNKPVIKCTPTSIEGLYVGDTAAIETEPTGASFRSESDEFATVTQEGIVTGVKAGATNIIVSKEGYQDATVAVTLRDKLNIEVVPETIETLYVGEETSIVTDPNVVEFNSEDTRIATVTDRGVVTGVRVGSTNIVITKEGFNDVKVPVNVQDKATIKCTPQAIETLYVDDETTIVTEPTGATFRSENQEYATVTPEGAVRGVAAGSTNIIVSKEGYNDTTVPVTVQEKPSIQCTPSEIVELQVGLQETITTVPTGVTFRSESDEYATVTPEGAVTGVQEGSTNIVITKEGYKEAKVAVTVIPRKVVTCDPASIVDLVVGQTQQLTATPSNATFRVENPEAGFITVTPEGLVEAVAQGEAKVIVEAEGYQAAEVVVTTKNAEE